MRFFQLAAAAAVCAFTAGPAWAVDFTLGTVNSGPQSPVGYGSLKLYADFNTSNTMGLTGGSLKTGSNGTIFAQPYGDNTQYYAVGPDEGSPASIAIGGFNRVSLYWGSIDYYNTISFLGAGGSVIQSFTGSQLVGGMPTGAASYTVTFSLNAAEAAQVTGIRFSSTVDAFEFDNLAIGTAVPEPATWAMMMVGLGVVGGGLRRRTRTRATLRLA